MSDYLDVVFAGIRLSALSEPAITDDYPYNETTLASGNTFVQTSQVKRFAKTYKCLTIDDVERDAVRSKAGIFADLVIDGVTYSTCCIKPPLKFVYTKVPGRWEYEITFVQHGGTTPVSTTSYSDVIIDGGSA